MTDCVNLFTAPAMGAQYSSTLAEDAECSVGSRRAAAGTISLHLCTIFTAQCHTSSCCAAFCSRAIRMAAPMLYCARQPAADTVCPAIGCSSLVLLPPASHISCTARSRATEHRAMSFAALSDSVIRAPLGAAMRIGRSLLATFASR